MTLLIKAGTGLVAGVVAGVLGLAFLPRVETTVEPPRAAVGKPQFVETSPSPKATLQVTARAAPAVAVAEPVSPPAPAPANSVQTTALPAPASAPAAAAPKAAAAIAVAVLDPPKPAPTSVTRSLSFAEDAPAATPAARLPVPAAKPAAPALKAADEQANATAASPAAADMSVQGLVALARGDLSTARLYLTRAAEAGEPRAWVALADSYDPAMLARLGVVGAPGDAQRAKDYLEKAAAAGVVGAKDRMAALDQSAR